MAASTAVRPSVQAALAALVDYAGLFPPAELPLAQAVHEYQAARAGSQAWMLGRFIVGAASVAALPEALASLSVIADPTADALNRVAQLRTAGAKIEALEISLAKSVSEFRESLSRDEILDTVGALEADLATAGLRGVPTFLEIPRTEPWRGIVPQTLEAIARLGLGAKLRCGGVVAQAFPAVEEVAAFIEAVASTRVPFKATAGLHHPVRHGDAASGFMMHGFLNILAAAALASRVDHNTLVRIIAEEDSSVFAFDDDSFSWRGQRIDLPALEETRRSNFVGYGSCSFAEPVEDLMALGVLPAQ
jgi:hypothetical protein